MAALTVGAVAVFGLDTVMNTVNDAIGGVTGGTEVIGNGGSQVLIASSANTEAGKCSTDEMVAQKKCGDLNVLIVDANRMPFIARNTRLAWESGRPGLLTMNRPKQRENRTAACPRSFLKPYGGQCDEYPMAVTDEGGEGARAEEVPGRENSCQGGMYGAQYPKDGDKFLVVIAHPQHIAPHPFTGTDIAKDQGWC